MLTGSLSFPDLPRSRSRLDSLTFFTRLGFRSLHQLTAWNRLVRSLRRVYGLLPVSWSEVFVRDGLWASDARDWAEAYACVYEDLQLVVQVLCARPGFCPVQDHAPN